MDFIDTTTFDKTDPDMLYLGLHHAGLNFETEAFWESLPPFMRVYAVAYMTARKNGNWPKEDSQRSAYVLHLHSKILHRQPANKELSRQHRSQLIKDLKEYYGL